MTTEPISIYKIEDDWDLRTCLEYNEQDGLKFTDIERVLAIIPGEHDGADYYWILLLRDGTIAALQGGCDYSGWDCRSYAKSAIFSTSAEAAKWFTTNSWEEIPQPPEVVEDLLRQVREGVATTPRQIVADAMKKEGA